MANFGSGARVERSVRVRHEDLRRFITAAFQAKGMSAADADVVAETLVWANLRGGDGHGVVRLPRYLEMIDRGDMDPRGRPRMALETEAFFILDAGRAAGPIAMMEAVAAASRARQGARRRIGIMRDATHAAAIGRYAHWVVERGLACIILAAAYPFMPYHGVRKASLPTAPIVHGHSDRAPRAGRARHGVEHRGDGQDPHRARQGRERWSKAGRSIRRENRRPMRRRPSCRCRSAARRARACR